MTAERQLCVDLIRKYLLFDSQRAVSWHEVQDCITAVLLAPDRRPTQACEHCGGLGHLCDGSFSLPHDPSTYRPCTVCPVCGGARFVRVEPCQ